MLLIFKTQDDLTRFITQRVKFSPEKFASFGVRVLAVPYPETGHRQGQSRAPCSHEGQRIRGTSSDGDQQLPSTECALPEYACPGHSALRHCCCAADAPPSVRICCMRSRLAPQTIAHRSHCTHSLHRVSAVFSDYYKVGICHFVLF